MNTKRRSPVAPLAFLLLALTWAAGPVAAQSGDDSYASEAPVADGSYSYLRVIDGSATLTQVGSGDRTQAEVNQPLLAGDRLWVAPGSRVEVLLSDRNLLRVDGGTEVVLEQLADSPDTGDRETSLRISSGEIQVVVYGDALGDRLPTVSTPNATVYLQDTGTYRIAAGPGDWTEVVARRGYAEVVTAQGSLVVRADQRAVVEGTTYSRASVEAANPEDPLERWGFQLERQATTRSDTYVDSSLRYAAAPLDRYGRWVQVSRGWAWRPSVEPGWSPYYNGRWSYTPSGLFWVSYEPWGWVPYHYGAWDFSPTYGWIWYPGHVFSPAWVYWYWGPSYVGWVPIGYYTSYYYPRYGSSFAFRFGVYGWAGGRFDLFHHWTFCSLDRFGHGRHHDFFFHGGRFGGHDRGDVLPRGIITTDTRGLTPDRWRDPNAVRTLLTRHPRRRDVVPHAAGQPELPDVTDFVARRPTLPGAVEHRVMTRTPDRVERVAEGPFTPLAVRPRDGARRPPARPEARGPATDTPALRRVVPGSPRSEGRPGLERRVPETGYRLGDGGATRALPSRPTSPTVREPRGSAPQRPSVTPRVGVRREVDGGRPRSVERPPSSRPSDLRPRTVTPGSRRPVEARPQSPRPESARPGNARPEAVRPGGDRPEATRPRSTRPGREAARPERRPPVRRVLEGVRSGTSGRRSVRRPAPSSPPPSDRRLSSPSRSGSGRESIAPRRPSARPSSGARRSSGSSHPRAGASSRSRSRSSSGARSRGGGGGHRGSSSSSRGHSSHSRGGGRGGGG